MIEKLIAELELDLNPNDIKVLCGRIRDEYNPKNGGAWVALGHPTLDGDVYVDGDGSTSQVSLLRTALKDLAELVNGEGEWQPMRYKFRGKRLDGEWVHGDLIQVPSKNFASIMGQKPCDVNHEVIPESVGQWTGLVDRHGKEIFEGDALRYSDGEILAVEFDNRTAQFTAKTRWLWTIIDVCEIIGNIHDNPELMEV